MSHADFDRDAVISQMQHEEAVQEIGRSLAAAQHGVDL